MISISYEVKSPIGISKYTASFPYEVTISRAAFDDAVRNIVDVFNNVYQRSINTSTILVETSSVEVPTMVKQTKKAIKDVASDE